MTFERSMAAGTTSSPAVGGDGLSKDEVFDLLRNRRRRDVLRYLVSVDRTATLSELSEHIAALENDVTVEEVDSRQRKRVYVALYQTHLPKLDRADVLDYESDRGNVLLSDRVSELRPYLDDGSGPATDGFRSTGRFSFYLGATAGGAVLIAHAVALQSQSLRLSFLSSLLFVLLVVSFAYTLSERGP